LSATPSVNHWGLSLRRPTRGRLFAAGSPLRARGHRAGLFANGVARPLARGHEVSISILAWVDKRGQRRILAAGSAQSTIATLHSRVEWRYGEFAVPYTILCGEEDEWDQIADGAQVLASTHAEGCRFLTVTHAKHLVRYRMQPESIVPATLPMVRVGEGMRSGRFHCGSPLQSCWAVAEINDAADIDSHAAVRSRYNATSIRPVVARQCPAPPSLIAALTCLVCLSTPQSTVRDEAADTSGYANGRPASCPHSIGDGIDSILGVLP